MKLLRYILWALVLVVMILIYQLSAQPAEKSDKVSKGFTGAVVNTMPHTKNLPENEKHSIVVRLDGMIRKGAHFFLFFILGLLIMAAIAATNREISIRTFVLTVAICLVYAISDETHQIFVDGRSFQISDILIDTVGSVLGAGVLLIGILRK
ncbi:MAG: VanZ family protein [Clostridiaceae bacterium]|jgi:VanZ family protein|nr:VanZ family protein [Clostridiaceae bacterium]